MLTKVALLTYPPQVLSLIGKHLLFLIERENVESRCLRDVVNNPIAYMINQIFYDKQVLRMFHSKEFLTVAQEVCEVLNVIIF